MITDNFEFGISTHLFDKLKHKPIRNLGSIPATLAIKLFKKGNNEPTFDSFLNWIDLPSLSNYLRMEETELLSELKQCYEDIQPLTIEDLFKIRSVEIRGAFMFVFDSFYDVVNQSTDSNTYAMLTDRIVLDKPYLDFKDVYELYTVVINRRVFQFVRMFCPSTKREYCIFIPPKYYENINKLSQDNVKTVERDWLISSVLLECPKPTIDLLKNPERGKQFVNDFNSNLLKQLPDKASYSYEYLYSDKTNYPLEYLYSSALDGLLSIYQVYVDEEHIEYIKRQGELILIKVKDDVDINKVLRKQPRKLTAEEYFNKLIIET